MRAIIEILSNTDFLVVNNVKRSEPNLHYTTFVKFGFETIPFVCGAAAHS